MIKTVDAERYRRIEELFLQARASITDTQNTVDGIVDNLVDVLEVVEEDELNMGGGSTVWTWIWESVQNSETFDEMLKGLDLEVKE